MCSSAGIIIRVIFRSPRKKRCISFIVDFPVLPHTPQHTMPTNTNHTQTDVSASNEAPLAPLVRQERPSDTPQGDMTPLRAIAVPTPPSTPEKIAHENMLKFQGIFLSDMDGDQIRSALESLGQKNQGSDTEIRLRLKETLKGKRKWNGIIKPPKRKTYKTDRKIVDAVDSKTKAEFVEHGKKADEASVNYCDSLANCFDLDTQVVALRCQLEHAQTRSKTWIEEAKGIRKKLAEMKQSSKTAKRKLVVVRKEAMDCVKKYRRYRVEARKKARIVEVERTIEAAKETERKASEQLAKLAE